MTNKLKESLEITYLQISNPIKLLQVQKEFLHNQLIKEMEEANINILELLEGHKKLIVVDSICTKKALAGAIHKLSLVSFKEKKQPYSSHQMGFSRVMDMAKTFKMDIPEEIVICAMAIKKTSFFKNGLSWTARKSLPDLVNLIKKEVLWDN